MSPLIERLRKWQELETAGIHGEAANEIARLTSVMQRVEADLEICRSNLNDVLRKNDSLYESLVVSQLGNQKFLEAVRVWWAGGDNLEFYNTAIAISTDHAALNKYRNDVLEEAANICYLKAKASPSSAGSLRAMKCAESIRNKKEQS